MYEYRTGLSLAVYFTANDPFGWKGTCALHNHYRSLSEIVSAGVTSASGSGFFIDFEG